MSTVLAERAVRPPTLPGAAALRGVRRLIIVALIASLVYGILATASWGTCPGGVDASGGFIDANGDPTSTAPSCISLTMGPNPLLYVVFALIGIGAVSSALTKSSTESDALRYINAAAVVILGITVVSIVVSQIWFWNLPVAEWDGTIDFAVFGPFPFATLTTEITPMAT